MLLAGRRILKIRMSVRVLDPLKHGKMAYARETRCNFRNPETSCVPS